MMHRYFFSAFTSGGENANAFIDARNTSAAILLYHNWAESVVGEVPEEFHIWRLPPVGKDEKSLGWDIDIIEAPV